MEAARATGGEFAATWRNQAGEILGSTSSATMCELRRNTWWLRISHEDFTAIVPCGECAGCLEFYRRRLADRLKRKYQDGSASGAARSASATTTSAGGAGSVRSILYLIQIFAPLEYHAALSRKLHRRRGVELEPGFLRLGATSFAVLSRVKSRPPLRLHGVVLETRTEAILLSRGRRAWRSATAGMLRERTEWGAQVKRWYIRGLPRAEKLDWTVDTQGGAKDYIKDGSPRAWKGNNIVLVPPDFWKLSRAERCAIRTDFGRKFSPEGYARVIEIVRTALARQSQSLPLSPAVRPVLSREQVVESYRRRAMKPVDASGSEPPSDFLIPPSEGGPYVSSVHLGGAGPPPNAAVAAEHSGLAPWVPQILPPLPEDGLTEMTHKQFLHRRIRKDIDASLVRMRELAKRRT